MSDQAFQSGFHLIRQWPGYIKLKEPVIVTVGNFDGVHLGHQFLIKELRKRAGKDGTVVVVTYRNHPSSFFKPTEAIPQIISYEHKLRLLAELGVDVVHVLNFNEQLSSMSAEEFIEAQLKTYPMKELVLGEDGVIGKKREGTSTLLEPILSKKGVKLSYLNKLDISNQKISSTQIRDAISNADFNRASKLLGRPYSVSSRVVHGHHKGRETGVRTANLRVEGLCLPPFGVYAVSAQTEDSKKHPAIANLGVAPSMHSDREPLLEVHLLGGEFELYHKEISVEFNHFIRCEKAFASINELKVQIKKDIEVANQFWAR